MYVTAVYCVPDTQLAPFAFHRKKRVVPDGQADVLAEAVSETPLFEPLTLKAAGALIGVVPLTVADAALSTPPDTAKTRK